MVRVLFILVAVVAAVSAQGYESPTAAPAPAQAYPEETPAPAPAAAPVAAAPAEDYAPAPAATPAPAAAPAEDYNQNEKAGGSKTIQFPLKSCYLNDDGFMCCNKELETLMSNTYETLAKSRNGKWKKCNIHQVTVAIQRAAQERFDVQFEAVTGAGDFASKNNFSGDLVCKIKRDSSYILAYATPQF